MRRTLTAIVPTKETELAGSKRLSASAARARIESGGGGVSLMKKMACRRSVVIGGLLPASGGSMAPPPERQFFAQGAEGTAQYEAAMQRLQRVWDTGQGNSAYGRPVTSVTKHICRK